MSIVVLVSAVFFLLAYKYFQFWSDFYYESNLIVWLMLVSIYVLGFFLGRFFPYPWDDSFDDDEDEAELPSFMKTKEVKKVDIVDFKNTGGMTGDSGVKKDNLQLLEWIGPKVQDLLYSHGVHTFAELSNCSIEKLQWILKSGGERFMLCNPDTWSYQAKLAASKEWSELKEYQDSLLRGAL